METENKTWEQLSRAEKNHQIFLQQKELLDLFLEKHAITQAQQVMSR